MAGLSPGETYMVLAQEQEQAGEGQQSSKGANNPGSSSRAYVYLRPSLTDEQAGEGRQGSEGADNPRSSSRAPPITERQTWGLGPVRTTTRLGDGAVSMGKSATGLPGDTLSGPHVEIIGWAFDLPAQHVALSAGRLETSLHGFLSVIEFQPMPIKVLQRLASTCKLS
ncbi:hypothetical protein B484DRAFT_407701 [Ochromonadaceae sp. CCMP2298]|nr:hypothetical protein B484DRAFT_407701 [Ochromonadaceae sp. CCMP2298]